MYRFSFLSDLLAPHTRVELPAEKFFFFFFSFFTHHVRVLFSPQGHIAMLNGGCWDAVEKNRFYTCGTDSTVREWDASAVEAGKVQRG